MKKVYGSLARTLSALILMIVAVAPALRAQSFAPVPGLSFTKTFGGANPLPQVVTVNSTGSAFNVTATASTTTGGTWLQISPSSGLYPSPAEWVVSVNPSVSLAAGTYTGSVVFAEYPSGVPSLTVPVSLVITAAGKPFFDDMNGEVSFSLTPGQTPPAQSIQIRNGGSGTLNWTAVAATADGGNWLTLSATSGKAPTTVSVGLVPSALPGGGTTDGTFIAMIVFQASNCTVTVPVRVTVAANGFSQINPLNFTMPFGGLSPLPQVITVASTGTNFDFTLSNSAAYTGNGGNWLQVAPNSGLHATPSAFTVGIINASALPAGSYTGEIIFTEYSQNTLVLTIPVTLTIEPSTASFFDNLPGGLSYFMTTGGSSPGQPVQIHNGGSGTLSWTASKITADGGSWLTLSATSGKAPSTITVGIAPAKLPGGGLTAGTYCGQVLLKTSGDAGTIPVCAVVGDSVFRQQNPISFTMTEGGANPLSQVLQIASNDNNFDFTLATASTGTGGSWLSVSPNSGLMATPTGPTVSVSASTLPAGNYTGELVYFEYSADTMALVVPVNLEIDAPGSAGYFDSLPGALSFYTITGGTPPPQTLEVRNAGSGTLSFTAAVNTSDGGSWLKVSPTSGTAPATLSVSIVPGSLPGGGLITGTYCGELTLQTTGDVGTVPVCVVVGDNSTHGVFKQINPLNFTMTTGGANPLPQEITVASTGNNFDFTNIGVSTSTGGNWLAINPSSGLLSTPGGITVSVNASTLPAGTYTGEIVLGEYPSRTMMLTVPVTLTIAPSTGIYFDNLPGELSFFSVPGGTPPAQAVQVRNAGSGTLKWTGSVTTSDGGKWLTLSVASGTAPTMLNISVKPGNLPGGGLVAGTYCGQVVFVTTGDTATIPVCETVGPNVFRQVNPLSFTMPFGGQNPLPQVIPVTSTGTNFDFTVTTVSTSKGGNWLTLDATSGLFSTPGGFWASVNASTLQPGTYTGEIVFSEYSTNTMVLTVPVTLTVTSCGPLFDTLPGLLSYSFVPSTTNPPAQSVQIRPAGSGALKWTAITSTSDGGAWLTVSSKSGTAPSTVTVKVVNSALPGQGLVAGNFNGQVFFQSSGGNVTIPVTVVVGANVFSQVPALTFNMTLGGSNPSPQPFSVGSTGTNFDFVLATATAGNGGNWLGVAPNSGLHATPTTITASVNGSGVLAGTYTGQIIFTEYSTNTMLMSVPVTFIVSDPHVPATIKATAGTPQSATVNKNFANPLVATVQDAGGDPVSGVLLTFNPPTNGASGSFACGNTAVTNSQGIATSQVFKANTIAGKYTVKATGDGLTSNPSFVMTNKAGPPASITATAGTPQTAAVNTAFATDLGATVQDIYGNGVPNKTVTFNLPSSGPSGTFAGGVNTAKTDSHGVATAAVLTANTAVGSYTVTADIGTFTTNPGFDLTNQAGAPATITATAGTPQTATVKHAFATNLSVTVVDAFSNPVPNATVTFNAPSSGASGTFAGGVKTATTNASGVATAAVFTANTKAGSYTVTATTGGVTTSPGFALTNKAGAAATITASGGTPQTTAVNTAFPKPLKATVDDSFGNPVAGATVTFTAPTSGASGTFAGGVKTAKTNSSGVATSAVFTANGTAGSYTVTGKAGTVTTSPGYQLTNQ